MVLNDVALEALALSGAIVPYDPSQLQPASIDLKLGSTFRVLNARRYSRVDLRDVPLDLTEEVEIPEEGFELLPGMFALGRTVEWIHVPNNMVGRLEGKSSLGRLGLLVHATAGFFDPGFMGFATLEFVNVMNIPILLVPGLPICQFVFMTMTAPAQSPYSGRYQDGNDAAGSRYGHDKTRWNPMPKKPPPGFGIPEKKK